MWLVSQHDTKKTFLSINVRAINFFAFSLKPFKHMSAAHIDLWPMWPIVSEKALNIIRQRGLIETEEVRRSTDCLIPPGTAALHSTA